MKERDYITKLENVPLLNLVLSNNKLWVMSTNFSNVIQAGVSRSQWVLLIIISYIPSGTSELAEKYSSRCYSRGPKEQVQLHEHIFSLGCITFVSILLAKARLMDKPNINDTYSSYGSEHKKVNIIEQ